MAQPAVLANADALAGFLELIMTFFLGFSRGKAPSGVFMHFG
jgi:hypothetical protein